MSPKSYAQAEFDQRRVIGQQQRQHLWMGKLRRAAEAAVTGVETLGELQHRAGHERGLKAAGLVFRARQLHQHVQQRRHAGLLDGLLR